MTKSPIFLAIGEQQAYNSSMKSSYTNRQDIQYIRNYLYSSTKDADPSLVVDTVSSICHNSSMKSTTTEILLTVRNDGMPITEEMLVEFLMEHEITCAEDLDDLSHLIHLIRCEADTPCGAGWIDHEYYLH